MTDGRSVLIGQPKGAKDTVVIQAGIARSQSQIQELELLPKLQREDLMWSLRLLLVGMDIDYSPVEYPLVLIHLTTIAYLEGLHKDAFLQKVTHLFKSIEAVYLTIDRAVAGLDSTPETTH